MSIAALPFSHVCGGVYDDCKAWYHFDYATNYTPGVANVASTNEIRDQRSWGSTAVRGAGGYHATGVQGALGGPQWTNCPVTCPAGGQRYGALSMLFDPSTNALGQNWPESIQINNLSLPGSSTIVTRFLWNGFAYSSGYPGWIFNNNLDWNGRRGWMFGVRGDSGTRLGMYVGQTAFFLDTYTVVTGKWYDAAAVLTDNGPTNTDTVELYIWPEDGYLTYRKFTTSAVTNSVGTSVSIIGSEPYQTGYGYATNSNSGKCFKGLVNHLAVWNRALSYAEIAEAFGYPHPRFQIGLDNNSINEFRPESEVDADYNQGDPWHTMRRAVTATYTDATLKLPIAYSNVYPRLPYVFHVKTQTDTGASAGLTLLVNNITNATQLASSGSQLYWFVSTNLLVNGTNSFTLRYAGGSAAYVGFDWMELAGSWQVGYEDNNQPEFVQESSTVPDDYYVTDPNWKHLQRAVTYGETNNILHFVLSPDIKSKYQFTYTTRIIGQGPSALTNYPFNVCINNVYTKSFPAVTNGTYIKLPLNRSWLVGGDNSLRITYNGPSGSAGGGWLQFDFHRLQIGLWPAGTLMLVR